MVLTSFLLFLAFSTVMIHGAPLKVRSSEHDLAQEKAIVVPPSTTSQSGTGAMLGIRPCNEILPGTTLLNPQGYAPIVATCISNTVDPRAPNPVKPQDDAIAGFLSSAHSTI
ncbi:hypothetical protein BCR42DRAFT_443882 [Absidia repens]|uniref:Uncharacterized protein n=1 Tax=Absidia repens TaxID=90262 RepID=A0A1X2HYN2_9FUNG|nr:hypothetical protein BCR42DRAFT_443882 [Absidia repens]